MHLVHQLGKPAWLMLVFLGLLIWWPLGIGTAFYGLVTGRLLPDRGAGLQESMRGYRDRKGAKWSTWRSSGNHAFDDYKAETLRRLEDEQREFKEFLERLRKARDKAEFDQFMADRRHTTPAAKRPEAA